MSGKFETCADCNGNRWRFWRQRRKNQWKNSKGDGYVDDYIPLVKACESCNPDGKAEAAVYQDVYGKEP